MIVVYDIETFASCFTYTDINIETKEINKFIIHKDKEQLLELYNHLLKCRGQIGFNNLAFDYPILHFIMKKVKYKSWEIIETSKIIEDIYNETQRIINIQNNHSEKFQTSVIRDKDVLIPQLDLFKLWHFNNPARSCSLKALEIAMNYPNVLESPLHHSKKDITLEEVDDILEYNLNDVLATFEFYKLSLDKTQLRKDIKTQYNLDCRNYPDVKLGEQLLLKLYSELSDQDEWEVKKRKTYRNKIILSECIFDYIKFESLEFNNLLTKFKSSIIENTKNGIEESVIYKGFKYDFGQGGIHGCIKSGVYKSDDEYIIIDCDVTSLYPSIAVLNRLYPEHLGEAFVDVYGDILKQRTKAKQEKNMSISDALKLCMNGAYG